MLLPACQTSKFYEHRIEKAYDQHGVERTDGFYLNTEYLKAIDADLQACYKQKK